MSRYAGKIGFAVTEETYPGVWTPTITEKPVKGEVLRNTRRNENGDSVNDNVTISNRISVIGNPYLFENFQFMKYVTWMHTKWKITSVEVSYPRLILDIGGVWNEQDESELTG